MGLFMSSSKRVVIKNITASDYIQIDNATTLSFFIVERNQGTPLQTIEYRVEKINGRSSDVLTDWVSINVDDIFNDIYTFEYTASGVTEHDRLLFKFKVVDTDGIEYFETINNLLLIA